MTSEGRSAFEAPAVWQVEGSDLPLPEARPSALEWALRLVDLLGTFPKKGALGLTRGPEEEWGLELSDPVRFETETHSWVGYKGEELGYVVTVSSRWELTSASVSVLGAVHEVVADHGSVFFVGLDARDPRAFIGQSPGRFQGSQLGSAHIPTRLGPPRQLLTYLLERHDVPTGSAVSLVLVSRQVFPIPSSRSFPRPRP